MAILTLDSIYFSYSQKPILRGIFLKCETGNIIALCGENGSGKSTLLKIIAGQLAPSNCIIKVDSKFISPAKRFNSIAWLPQESFLSKNINIKQAISLFCSKNQRALIYADDRITQLAQRKIRNLSGGEKRYLETSLVLSLNRDFYILDEPFTEVEPLYRTKIFDKIKNLSKTAGFILVDHNLDAMAKVANKQLFLNGGKIFPIKDLLKSKA